MGAPRTTHTWLKSLYDYLDRGVSVQPASATTPVTRVGSPTGLVGLYGQTGIAVRLATGTAGITGVTGAGGNTGASVWWFNGGSGNYYTIDDVVTSLKNAGVLKP